MVGELIAAASRLGSSDVPRSVPPLHRACCAWDGPRVAFVHGIAGVGKSTLDARVRRRSPGARRRPSSRSTAVPSSRPSEVVLCAHRWPPSAMPLRRSTEWSPAGSSTMRDTVVLALDSYELVRGLEPVAVPRPRSCALSARVRLVLAGREAPMTGWTTALGPLLPTHCPWAVAEQQRMRPTMLRNAGVAARPMPSASTASRRGHPLSLMLAAAALARPTRARPSQPATVNAHRVASSLGSTSAISTH